LKILHCHNPSRRITALGTTLSLTRMGTRNISWGVKAAAADPTTFTYRLSWNLRASTSWNPHGLLYLFCFYPSFGPRSAFICSVWFLQQTATTTWSL